MDALGCWGLVNELVSVTNCESACCSFKHTSPAGAAVSVDWEKLSYASQTLLSNLYGLTPDSSAAVNAYIRSRSCLACCIFFFYFVFLEIQIHNHHLGILLV